MSGPVKWWARRMDVPASDRDPLIMGATGTVDVLGIGEGGLAQSDPFTTEVIPLVNGGTRFRILLVRPRSPSANRRARWEPSPLKGLSADPQDWEAGAPEEFHGRHEGNVRRWEALARAVVDWEEQAEGEEAPRKPLQYHKFCLRVYNCDPKLALIRSNKGALVTQYAIGSLGDWCPTELHEDPLPEGYDLHFGLLWQRASHALVWLIVSDVDGVLGDVSGREYPPEQLTAWFNVCLYAQLAHARYMRYLGDPETPRDKVPSWPPLTLCTGRAAAHVRQMLAQMTLAPGIPCICESGAVFLYSPDSPIVVNPVIAQTRPQSINDLTEAARLLDNDPDLSRDPQAKDVMVTRNADKSAGETPAALAQKATDFLREHGFVVLDRDNRRISADDLGTRRCVHVTRGGEAMDILPVVVQEAEGGEWAVGLTKGHAVTEVARSLAEAWSGPDEELDDGAEKVLQHTVAIGDSEGDMPMFEVVAYPTCPNGAAPDIQAYCRGRGGYVAGQDMAKGAREIIDHYSGALWEGTQWLD